MATMIKEVRRSKQKKRAAQWNKMIRQNPYPERETSSYAMANIIQNNAPIKLRTVVVEFKRWLGKHPDLSDRDYNNNPEARVKEIVYDLRQFLILKQGGSDDNDLLQLNLLSEPKGR